MFMACAFICASGALRNGQFAAIAFALWLGMAYFAVTAKAVEANVRNDSFSALRDYVRSIDTNRKSTDSDRRSNNSSGPDSIDAAYATLRAFAAQNGVEQPPSTAGQSKLADADSLLDFLRQGGSSAKPSVAPQKGPVGGRNAAERSRRRHLCRREGLHDLPCKLRPNCSATQ